MSSQSTERSNPPGYDAVAEILCTHTIESKKPEKDGLTHEQWKQEMEQWTEIASEKQKLIAQYIQALQKRRRKKIQRTREALHAANVVNGTVVLRQIDSALHIDQDKLEAWLEGKRATSPLRNSRLQIGQDIVQICFHRILRITITQARDSLREMMDKYKLARET